MRTFNGAHLWQSDFMNRLGSVLTSFFPPNAPNDLIQLGHQNLSFHLVGAKELYNVGPLIDPLNNMCYDNYT